MQFQTLSEISGATLYQSLRNGASHDGAAAQHAEVMAAGFKGALVNRISSGFAIGTVATPIEWNNEVDGKRPVVAALPEVMDYG
jgi:hypothetical protein